MSGTRKKLNKSKKYKPFTLLYYNKEKKEFYSTPDLLTDKQIEQDLQCDSLNNEEIAIRYGDSKSTYDPSKIQYSIKRNDTSYGYHVVINKKASYYIKSKKFNDKQYEVTQDEAVIYKNVAGNPSRTISRQLHKFHKLNAEDFARISIEKDPQEKQINKESRKIKNISNDNQLTKKLKTSIVSSTTNDVSNKQNTNSSQPIIDNDNPPHYLTQNIALTSPAVPFIHTPSSMGTFYYNYQIPQIAVPTYLFNQQYIQFQQTNRLTYPPLQPMLGQLNMLSGIGSQQIQQPQPLPIQTDPLDGCFDDPGHDDLNTQTIINIQQHDLTSQLQVVISTAETDPLDGCFDEPEPAKLNSQTNLGTLPTDWTSYQQTFFNQNQEQEKPEIEEIANQNISIGGSK